MPTTAGPRLKSSLFRLRLLDPSMHGLFAMLSTRFSQDDNWCGRFSAPIGHPEHREGYKNTFLCPQPRSPRLHQATKGNE